MTGETDGISVTIPKKDQIVVLAVLGILNLLAATLVLVLQAGALIVGKSIGGAHIVLGVGWLITGALGTFLLVNAHSRNVKRQKAIQASRRKIGKERTREIHRDSFNFYEGEDDK